MRINKMRHILPVASLLLSFLLAGCASDNVLIKELRVGEVLTIRGIDITYDQISTVSFDYMGSMNTSYVVFLPHEFTTIRLKTYSSGISDLEFRFNLDSLKEARSKTSDPYEFTVNGIDYVSGVGYKYQDPDPLAGEETVMGNYYGYDFFEDTTVTFSSDWEMSIYDSESKVIQTIFEGIL